ncbi:MAG: splicing factor 3b, subunit 1, partial [Olpidium bornovanus]
MEDVDRQVQEQQEARQAAKLAMESGQKVRLGGEGGFDEDIYGSARDKFEGYSTTIPMEGEQEGEGHEDEEDDQPMGDDEETRAHDRKKLASYTAPKEVFREVLGVDGDGDAADPFKGRGAPSRVIAEREDEYHSRRFKRTLSPERVDAFGEAAATNENARSYAEVIRENELRREEERVMRAIVEKKKAEAAKAAEPSEAPAQPAAVAPAEAPTEKRRKRRWDMGDTSAQPVADAAKEPKKPGVSRWDQDESEEPGLQKTRWDETPKPVEEETPSSRKRSRWDETPVAAPAAAGNAWDATPKKSGAADETPKKRSRWDETPVHAGIGATLVGGAGLVTPTPGQLHLEPMTPEAMNAMRWEKEGDARNRPLSNEELDAMFPPGYKILEPPASYVPIHTPARKLMATPTPMGETRGFMSQGLDEEMRQSALVDLPSEIPGVGPLPFFKQEDMQHFGKLLDKKDDSDMTVEELRERKIMRLLLKIKNGTPPMRKTALRQITDKAREFGAGPLFSQILPLLMSPTLEDQERHLLVGSFLCLLNLYFLEPVCHKFVKVIDRILYKLDDLVRPYVHKILVVIEPLLIDEDYYARVEGREIISNLSKAAGLATMIATMRPDIDHVDEYVRNTTARAFSVVASALGIPALLPFLKAVCRSKKSWQARHTGIKIVQQISILLGCAVLPHLKSLVDCIAHGLEDEQQKVRTITALAIAALAEAAAPYGIESFDSVLKPLWTGIRKHRGKGLAAFLKAIGYIIPLMDSVYANYYTKEVVVILRREFLSPDEEMKKIVLKVVKQCAATDGVTPAYIKEEILPEFFKNFWVRRMALDRRNYKQLVETTVELAQRVGVSEILSRIVEDLKDESE